MNKKFVPQRHLLAFHSQVRFTNTRNLWQQVKNCSFLLTPATLSKINNAGPGTKSPQGSQSLSMHFNGWVPQ